MRAAAFADPLKPQDTVAVWLGVDDVAGCDAANEPGRVVQPEAPAVDRLGPQAFGLSRRPTVGVSIEGESDPHQVAHAVILPGGPWVCRRRRRSDSASAGARSAASVRPRQRQAYGRSAADSDARTAALTHPPQVAGFSARLSPSSARQGPQRRTWMIVFPLRRSVELKVATASSRDAMVPMFVRSRPSRTRCTISPSWSRSASTTKSIARPFAGRASTGPTTRHQGASGSNQAPRTASGCRRR